MPPLAPLLLGHLVALAGLQPRQSIPASPRVKKGLRQGGQGGEEGLEVVVGGGGTLPLMLQPHSSTWVLALLEKWPQRTLLFLSLGP